MENNDYTSLDWLFPNQRTLNEDTSAGKEEPPAVAPSVSVNNPPDNKIPADQKKTDKPAEDMPKFKCPKCMSESAETETKGKYKCSKCGQTFSVDEMIKEDEDKETYKIVRYYRDSGHADHQKVIETGLTREEAKKHCSDPDSKEEGVWFDGFVKEDE